MPEARSQPRGTGTLLVTGPSGVEIQIIDAWYNGVARGTEKLEGAFPSGLYYIKWIAGAQNEQRVVRLLPGRSLQASGGAFQSGTANEVSEAIHKVARPALEPQDSAVMVLARVGPELDSVNVSSAEIRLYRADDVAMRSDTRAEREAEEDIDVSAECVARVYRVPPGAYRLRFRSLTGDTLEQTVCAIPGWRTVVALHIVEAQTLGSAGETFTTLIHHGVDPTRTVISSQRFDEADTRSDSPRLAEIFLSDLRGNAGSLSESLIESLRHDTADPFLRIYAAASIIISLDRGGWPAIDQQRPEDETERLERSEWWRAMAKALVEGLAGYEFIPDVTAALWRLASPATDRSRIPPLAHPPMLDCAWRWSVARSLEEPDAVPATPIFQSASAGRAELSPWLVWRQRAILSVGGETAPARGDAGRLDELVVRIAEQVASASTSPIFQTLQFDNYASYSPVTQAIATKSYGANQRDDAAPGYLLARSLRVPASILEAQAERALTELLDPAPKRKDPPALSRPVVDRDDPHKGRFGGLASVGGFTLSVAFKVSKPEAEWIDMQLIVTADDDVALNTKDKVVFYLHDTFNPDNFSKKFNKKRRATLGIGAFGGFTVGAWLPAHDIELELDLAKVPGAPRAIREW